AGAQPVVHRLPDPDDPRHATHADDDPGASRPARPLRTTRRRRATDPLLDPGDRRRRPRRHRPAPAPRPDPPRAHHPPGVTASGPEPRARGGPERSEGQDDVLGWRIWRESSVAPATAAGMASTVKIGTTVQRKAPAPKPNAIGRFARRARLRSA